MSVAEAWARAREGRTVRHERRLEAIHTSDVERPGQSGSSISAGHAEEDSVERAWQSASSITIAQSEGGRVKAKSMQRRTVCRESGAVGEDR